MGKAPLMGRTSPSRPSSPMITYLLRASIFLICSDAARIPIAIGRSNAVPFFLISAGARLTTKRVRGILKLLLFIVLSTRCRLSFTALSGKPTRTIPTPVAIQFTSIVIEMASTPYTALPKVLTSME